MENGARRHLARSFRPIRSACTVDGRGPASRVEVLGPWRTRRGLEDMFTEAFLHGLFVGLLVALPTISLVGFLAGFVVGLLKGLAGR